MREVERAVLPANLDALVNEAAARYGDQPLAVFFDDDVTLTYRDLASRATRLASSLARIGVTFGTHVGIMLNSGAHYPVAWLAIAKLGGVAVPINPAYTARELSFVVDDSDVRLLIIDAGLLPTFNASDKAAAFDVVVAAGPSNRHHGWDDMIEAGDEHFSPDRAPTHTDPSNIQYTSGTTGLPKGAIIPHGYWMLRGQVWKTQLSHTIRRNLVAQPMHYIDGQAMFLLTLASGGTAYVAARQSASRFLGWLKDYDIEFCSLPEVVARQLDGGASAGDSLKTVYAYSHRKETYQKNEARFGCPIRQGYGMTELGSALYVPVEADHMTGSGTVGVPTAGREVMIADETGQAVGAGIVGEIYVRGIHLFQGYYNRPNETEAAFAAGGWFKTGDIGRQDEAGWFYYLGRRKDMVRRSSENISATEVEEVLRGVPGVIEAAVLPVSDEKRGEEVKAYLRLEEGKSSDDVHPDAVLAHCAKNLARFKLPRYIEFIDDFPRTPGYKIKKSSLIADKPDLRVGAFDAVDGIWR